MELRKIRDTDFLISEDGKIFSPKGKQISTWIENNTGYTLFRIHFNGKKRCYRLHRILAECWIPNPDNLPFVKHKNDDRTYNTVSNLEWGANPDNVQEGYDNQRYKFKTRSYKVYVTNKETNEVLVFKSLRSLAETLGLNRKNVAAVLDNRKNNTYTNFEFSYQCQTTMDDACNPVEPSGSKREAA